MGQVQESIGLLSTKLREAQTAHQDLLRNKGRLEHDLAIKGNSLGIDRVKCLNQVGRVPLPGFGGLGFGIVCKYC